MPFAEVVGADTHLLVAARQVELLRTMTPADRFALAARLFEDARQMVAAGVRLRYPEASEHEVEMRVLALSLPRELMIDAYGWDPDLEGR